ncbi:MAG: AAA family ATPase [Caulobacterales bacterium]|nr:AAA family ATPase [Caulobacterales bacterium]
MYNSNVIAMVFNTGNSNENSKMAHSGEIPDKSFEIFNNPNLPMIDKAKEWAKLEYPVFPCNQDKKPITINGFKDATTVKAQIEEWWRENPNALIGIPTGSSTGIVVLDIDKKNNKDGFESIKEYGDVSKTLTVETPNNGKHYIYKSNGSIIKNSVGKLGNGIDVRGDGGYIIAAGSKINGITYKITDNSKIVEPPNWIDKPYTKAFWILKNEIKKVQNAQKGTRNETFNKSAFILFIEVKRGNLTEDEVKSALFEACSENGYINDDGKKAFNTTIESAKKGAYEQAKADISHQTNYVDIVAKPFDFTSPINVEPLPWIYENIYLRNAVTATVGAPGTGKSNMILTEAVELVYNFSLIGYKASNKSLNVWVLNIEDDENVLKSRVQGIIHHYKLKKENIGNLFIGTNSQKSFKLASNSKNGLTINKAAFDAIKSEIETKKIDLVILDPFVYFHDLQENDNSLISSLLEELSNLAKETKCAIHVVHHTGKSNSASDANIGRGASSFGGSARLIRSLESIGTKTNSDKNLIKTRVVKSNISQTGNEKYFEIVSVDLPTANHNTISTSVVIASDFNPKDKNKDALPTDALFYEECLEIMKENSNIDYYYNHQNNKNYFGEVVVKVFSKHNTTLELTKDRHRIGKFIDYGIEKKYFIKSKIKVQGKEKPAVKIPEPIYQNPGERFEKNKLPAIF